MRNSASLTFDRSLSIDDRPPAETADSGRCIGDSATNADLVAAHALPVPAAHVSRAERWLRAAPQALIRVAQSTIVPAVVFAAWWFVSSHGLLSEKILPAPSTVFATFKELLAGGDIATHLGVSLGRVALGAALGVTLGLTLGIALGFSATIETWVGPTFRTIAQVPSIALIPLLMMVLGIDDRLKLFIMVKACVIPIAFTTADGIRAISRQHLEVGEVFRLSRWTRVTKIILPGALPAISSGVRQGVAHVWVSLVAVEVLASAEGIGYLMTWGRLIFQLDVVLVCVAIIGAIGFTLDFSLRRLEAYLLRWRGKETV